MLSRLLKLRAPIQYMVTTNKVAEYLNTEDWDKITMIEGFLSPFAQIQKFLDGEKYVTISYVPLLVATMRRAIDNLCSIDEFSSLAYEMRDYFEMRFGTGEPGTLFNREIVRGPRQIRKGLRSGIYLAAACDPRQKVL